LEQRLLIVRINVRSTLPLLLFAALFTQSVPAAAQGTVMAFSAADGRGRVFDLAQLRGNVVAVTFVSRYTQDEAAEVNRALGTRSDVKVVTVVDFVGIPGFVHNYARKKIAQADDGRVQHLCDERGELRRQFGAHPDRHVDIFILDRDGSVRGRFEGQQQLDGALRLLDDVRSQAAR
jgi:hypothetical protein